MVDAAAHLSPAVVVWTAGHHLAIPVEAEPELVELLAHACNVAVGSSNGERSAGLSSCVFVCVCVQVLDEAVFSLQ